jgi:hypothetical protein
MPAKDCGCKSAFSGGRGKEKTGKVETSYGSSFERLKTANTSIPF